MSLVPMLFSDWLEDLNHPHRLLDQHFGLHLQPEQLLSPSRLEMYIPRERRHLQNYFRPWAPLLRQGEGGSSTVEADKNKFQVILDVQQFEPHEIDVKMVDNCIVVSAKHEEKKDEHGWISRQFVRKYIIPDQCDMEQVTSKLSSDGLLTISVPRKVKDKPENERQIKIEHTGKPALQTDPQKPSTKETKEQKTDKKE